MNFPKRSVHTNVGPSPNIRYYNLTYYQVDDWHVACSRLIYYPVRRTIFLSGGQYCAEGPENYYGKLLWEITMGNYYGKLLWIIVGRTWRKLRSQRTRTDQPHWARTVRRARKLKCRLPVLLFSSPNIVIIRRCWFFIQDVFTFASWIKKKTIPRWCWRCPTKVFELP